MEPLQLVETGETSTGDAQQELEQRLFELEVKTQEMQESIRYAGSLQLSILPNERVLQNVFSEAFVFFQPKDIVSGDFYWMYQYHDDVYFAVGDCTGHGVPGALINVAGSTLLRQIIRLEGVSDPAQIIRLLDDELISLFNDNLTVGARRDGMDIVFCKFNLRKKTGSFCGAGRPLLLIRDGELIEYKKGKDAIGYYTNHMKEFESVHFSLQPGDQFYLFTDGYTDQFGGDNVKKFNRKRFRNLLLSLDGFSLKNQKKELDLSFNNWKGNQEQIDDVCVVGVKI